MGIPVQDRAEEILKALKKRYPIAFTQLKFEDPWQLLVATILAAQCTDERVNQVTPAFFSAWPGPVQLAGAQISEVEAVIQPVGCYHNKAKNLIASAKMIVERFGGKVPATMEELIKLPGVARKTANVVLFGAFGINEGIAVDTHVKRISHRLGLTGSTDPVRIEQDLVKLFPREEWGDINHRLVWFGRDVCTARKPACSACEFAGSCPKLEPPRPNKKREGADEP